RLMPQYFLQQQGIALDALKGEVGFSGAHDKTIALVEAGSYDVGVLNSQVWESRLQDGQIDTEKVKVIWTSPTYYDYHWVINPNVARFGADFGERVQAALLKLDPTVPEQQAILELFGAERFIATADENYQAIETIGREIGLIVEEE
ncbi:PhnD/SsuA/transferrin family substrate-binding protein, partial [Candidatus Gracilibacteria bacterium]|nr:PhnD/SsuA/transferrin family substrate-binding protein [Candidatus Gracilibacteria bacterium]